MALCNIKIHVHWKQEHHTAGHDPLANISKKKHDIDLEAWTVWSFNPGKLQHCPHCTFCHSPRNITQFEADILNTFGENVEKHQAGKLTHNLFDLSDLEFKVGPLKINRVLSTTTVVVCTRIELDRHNTFERNIDLQIVWWPFWSQWLRKPRWTPETKSGSLPRYCVQRLRFLGRAVG